MKSIYGFPHYRDFLMSYYQEEKAKQRGFSYAKWSEKAEIQAPNYLKLIIDGGRNLTIETLHQVAKSMDLSGAEHEYFEALVLRDQAESKLSRKTYERKLKDLRALKPKRGWVAASKAPLLEMPQSLAVLVGLHGRRRDAALDFLSQETTLLRPELEKLIDELLKAGLVELSESGTFSVCHDHVLFRDRKSTSQSHRKFLAQQLELSKKLLETSYERGARFYSHTFTLSHEAWDRIADQIQAFSENLITQADQEAPEQIVQFNLQLFPIRLAKDKGSRV